MNQHKKISVLIADDHKMVRDGIKAILELDGSFTVVGEAADGEEAVLLCERYNPDILLLDISMPVLTGLDAALKIAKVNDHTKIIVLSMYSNKRYIKMLLETGVKGYVLKNAGGDDLINAVDMVLAGRKYLSPELFDTVIDSYAEEEIEGAPDTVLSGRQVKILELIADGKTTKEIALDIALGIKSVDLERAHIMQRLGIKNIAGLVRYAIKEGIARI